MKRQRVEEEDEPDSVKPDDFSDPLLLEYKQKLLESDGYHAIALPPHLEAHICAYAEINDEILQQLSQAALNSFNKGNQGAEEPIFVLHSVIMGNWIDSYGKLYKVTFRARPSNSDLDNDKDINEFQARVRYFPSDEKFPLAVGDCTLQLERKYPINFDEKDLLEFSEKALRFFNQKHQGSEFVLHGVISGNYTPIIGYSFRVMFRARASSEEDLKEFEAKLILNAPWVQSERVSVLECALREEALDPYNLKPKSMEKEEAEISEKSTRKFVALEIRAKEEDCSALFVEEYMKYVKSLNIPSGYFKSFTQSIHVEVDSKILQEMIWAAIDFFNKANGQGFLFHSMISGYFVTAPTRMYDILFRARPFLSIADEDIKEFVAVTIYRTSPDKDIPVLNCVMKSNREYSLDIKHDDLLRRYYVLDFTRSALDEYSKESLRYYNEKNKKSDFVFHSIVMGNFHPCAWRFYRVTFRARDNSDHDKIREFQARGLYRPWMDEVVEVKDCILKAENEFPIDFEDSSQVDFSKRAVNFYNENHEGSHFVYHSVVKCSNYTPIARSHVRLTFKATNNGDENDIREFEALLGLDISQVPFTAIPCKCAMKLESDSESKTVTSGGTRASSEDDLKEFEAKLILNDPWVQFERVTVLERALREEALYPYNPEAKSKEKEEAEILEKRTRKIVAFRIRAKEEDCSSIFVEEYMKYVKTLNIPSRYCESFNQTIRVEKDSKILQEMIWAAIDFFNKANGKDFLFHSMISGYSVSSPTRMFDILFRARPFLSIADDDIKEFVAVTKFRTSPEKDIIVLNCVMKSDREYGLDIKHDDLLWRYYVLDFTRSALEEYSNESLRYYNEKHKGSEYVLHSVVNVKETSIFGTPFTVIFRAKASNEEDLKDFEATLRRNSPRRKVEDGEFQRVTVLRCEIKNWEEERKRKQLEKETAKFKVETRIEDLRNPMLIEFKERILKSKEFYAMDLPDNLRALVNICPEFNEAYLVTVSEAAIKFYNIEHKSDFVFHSIVMGNFHRCCGGRFYRVTFRATSDTDHEKIREFQARAFCRPAMDEVVEVKDCFLKAENEFPIDFEESSLVDFSTRAVNFYNKNHEGSHFVFHSVVKCSNYSPIGRSNVSLTLKATNNGDENDIREFEALLGLDISQVPFTAIPCKCTMKSESNSESKTVTGGG